MINLIVLLPVIFVVSYAVMAWANTLLKKGKVTETVTISRMTQDGETVVVHTNFFEGMSDEDKFDKLQSAAGLGDSRLKFCDERFKALLDAEKAKQTELTRVK